jgi:uncharacterized protein YndB with AHSA1/START domain
VPADEIKLETKVAADPLEVYRMFTNSTCLRYWLADVAVSSPRPEGRLYLAWDDGYQMTGSFRKIEPGQRVSFGWQGTGDPGPTRVDIRIKSVDGDALVRLRHAGFDAGKRGRKTLKTLQTAWAAAFENLVSVMETGADLRITRRVLLGIFVAEELTPELGARFGVDHGVRVGGIVEGMGAASAGLLAGDIIVGLAGRRVDGSGDLRSIVSEHRAGDTVEVEFVRAGETHRVTMDLAGRQYNPLPASGGELAARVEQAHQQFLPELDRALDGIDEKAAWRPPGEGEWSIREILAHLIEGEIDGHSFLIAQTEGVEPFYDGTFGNSNLRVRTCASSYPDTWSMVESIRRALAQTVSILTGLPEEVVARRAVFWRIAFGFQDLEAHLTEHLEQIKVARVAKEV